MRHCIVFSRGPSRAQWKELHWAGLATGRRVFVRLKLKISSDLRPEHPVWQRIEKHNCSPVLAGMCGLEGQSKFGQIQLAGIQCIKYAISDSCTLSCSGSTRVLNSLRRAHHESLRGTTFSL